MKKSLKKILLSLTVAVPIIITTPVLLTSCSQLNPVDKNPDSGTEQKPNPEIKPEETPPTKPQTFNYFIIREKLVYKDRVFGVETTLTKSELRNKINENKNTLLDYRLFNKIVRLETENQINNFKTNPEKEVKENTEYMGAHIKNNLIEIDGETLNKPSTTYYYLVKSRGDTPEAVKILGVASKYTLSEIEDKIYFYWIQDKNCILNKKIVEESKFLVNDDFSLLENEFIKNPVETLNKPLKSYYPLCKDILSMELINSF